MSAARMIRVHRAVLIQCHTSKCAEYVALLLLAAAIQHLSLWSVCSSTVTATAAKQKHGYIQLSLAASQQVCYDAIV
jgi:hypothetical protein